MASTYTTSGIELIASGEQSGTWGDTTNDNWEIVDLQLNSRLSKTLSTAGSSGSPNALTITDGDKTSEGMYASVVFVDGGDLGANAYVRLEPNDVKRQIWVRNSLSASRSIFLFQGTYNASNDIELLNGYDYLVSFDGAGAGAVVTQVNNSFPATTFGLTEAELTQLQNIDSTTVSTTQWGYLGAMNQGVTTTSNVTFGTITGTGDMAIDTDTLFVDVSAGSVGIGTSSPNNRLHVLNGGTEVGVDRSNATLRLEKTTGDVELYLTGVDGHNGQIRFGDASSSYRGALTYVHSVDAMVLVSAGAERMRIDSSGDVGIGTATALGTLHISEIGKAGGGAPALYIGTMSAGTESDISLHGNAVIGGEVSVTHTFESGGYIRFGQATASETGTAGISEDVRINATGVGIGTTSPQVKLEISRLGGDPTAIPTLDANTALLVHSGAGAAGSGAKITLLGGNTSEVGIELGDVDTAGAGAITYRNSDNSLAFDTAASERVRITSSGNVGIGTTSPDTELDVDGAIKGKVEVNTPVSGTLVTTTHLRGAINNINGNITMPAGEAGGHAVITNNSSTARTVSRHAGLANLFVNGTNVSSATISGRGVVGVIYTASSICHLSGDVS